MYFGLSEPGRDIVENWQRGRRNPPRNPEQILTAEQQRIDKEETKKLADRIQRDEELKRLYYRMAAYRGETEDTVSIETLIERQDKIDRRIKQELGLSSRKPNPVEDFSPEEKLTRRKIEVREEKILEKAGRRKKRVVKKREKNERKIKGLYDTITETRETRHYVQWGADYPKHIGTDVHPKYGWLDRKIAYDRLIWKHRRLKISRLRKERRCEKNENYDPNPNWGFERLEKINRECCDLGDKLAGHYLSKIEKEKVAPSMISVQGVITVGTIYGIYYVGKKAYESEFMHAWFDEIIKSF